MRLNSLLSGTRGSQLRAKSRHLTICGSENTPTKPELSGNSSQGPAGRPQESCLSGWNPMYAGMTVDGVLRFAPPAGGQESGTTMDREWSRASQLTSRLHPALQLKAEPWPLGHGDRCQDTLICQIQAYVLQQARCTVSLPLGRERDSLRTPVLWAARSCLCNSILAPQPRCPQCPGMKTHLQNG